MVNLYALCKCMEASARLDPIACARQNVSLGHWIHFASTFHCNGFMYISALLKRIQHELCTLAACTRQTARDCTMAHNRRFVGTTQTAGTSHVVDIFKNHLTPSALSRCSKEHLLFLGHENIDKCATEHAMVFLQLQQLDPYVARSTLQEALVIFDTNYEGPQANEEHAREGQNQV